MSRKIFIILILELIFIIAFSYPVNALNDDNVINENNKLYINLDKTVISEGYFLSDKTERNIVYKKEKTTGTPEIVIKFSLGNNTAYKNEFRFSIKDGVKIKDGEIYIEKEKLENILNIEITVADGYMEQSPVIKTTPLVFPPHEWIKIGNGLVAHAGGAVDKEKNLNPPNCRQGVVNSYNNGHRVFEIDFNLTTDGKLAAVHDWAGYRGMKSSDEWKKIKIWDVFTSMLLEDVLDIMLVNKDMFLITDTKSFEYTQKQTEEQFRIIVETAKKKDPSLELLNRIIPQIYNQPMYNTVMKQYNFRSVIYTLYASPESNKQVVDFIKKHDDIQAVTMSPPRNTKEFVNNILQTGKYVYLHTINDLQEILNYKEAGIWGFYTDFIFPPDIPFNAVLSNGSNG